MSVLRMLVAVVLATSSLYAAAAEDPAEVDIVVAAVKAANPDFQALCQMGSDGIRKTITATLIPLVSEGKVSGNPQAIGGEAGQKIGLQCRGG